MGQEKNGDKCQSSLNWFAISIAVSNSWDSVNSSPDSNSYWHPKSSDQLANNELVNVFNPVLVDSLASEDLHPGSISCSHGVSTLAHIWPSTGVNLGTWECFSMFSSKFFFEEFLRKNFLLLLLSGTHTHLHEYITFDNNHKYSYLIIFTDQYDIEVFFSIFDVLHSIVGHIFEFFILKWYK